MTITIHPDFAKELNETLEDMVEYLCREAYSQGYPVSGETCWKLVSTYATTKEAEFAGLIDPD